MKKNFFPKLVMAVVLGLFMLLGPTGEALAEGTETLGPPDIAIAAGTGVVAAGTGLIDPPQPGTINIAVPPGAAVEQVLLYWEGQMSTDVAGDDTIVVDGIPVSGTLIGGQTFFFPGAWSSAFRADITGLGLVKPGANALEVGGLNFTKANNGAGVLVIFDDGSEPADIQVRDGIDLAFINFPEPRQSTVAQTYNFAPAGFDREANLSMFFSSVQGEVSGQGPLRPTSIEITVGGSDDSLISMADFEVPDVGDSNVNSGMEVTSGGFSFTSNGSIFIIGDPDGCGGGCADNGTQTLVSLDADGSFAGGPITITEASGDTFSIKALDVAEGILSNPQFPPATSITITGMLEDGGMVSEVFSPIPTDGTFQTFTTDQLAQVKLTSATISAAGSSPLGDGSFALDNIELAVPGGPPSGGETTIVSNLLNSNDGQEWDTLTVPVTIPANVTRLKVQAFSRDDENTGELPASFAWIGATLAVLPCQGQIGDRVWLDTDEDGCQGDPEVEPGIDGVTVELYRVPDGQDCDPFDSQSAVLFNTTVTKDGGQYLFKNLCPGRYQVEFFDPEGRDITIPETPNCPGDPDGEKDSNCKENQRICVTLDNDEDLTIDCGLIPPCLLEVEKFCSELPPPTGDPCDAVGKPKELVFRYTGEDCQDPLPNPQDGKAQCSGVAGGDGVSITIDKDADKISASPSSGINVGDLVTITTTENKLASETKFTIGGQSLAIHTSCSQDLNLDDQFGSMELVQVTGEEGGVVALPQPPALQKECEVIGAQLGSCADSKPKALVFQYTGEDCQDPLPNTQDGKASCSGVAGGDGVSITIDKDTDKVSANPSSGINVGDLVTITTTKDKLSSETKFTIGGQSLTIHTSCSQELNVDDVFGSMLLVQFIPEGASVPAENVIYTYRITNTGTTPITVDVVDDPLGTIANDLEIGTEAPVVITKTAVLTETTTNVVTVTDVDAPECQVMDEVTVTVVEPCAECKGGTTELVLRYLGMEEANVVVYDKDSADPNKILFDGLVMPNGEFTITPRPGQDDLDNNISIYVNHEFNTEIHTSCSQPIGPGLVRGDFLIVSGRSKDNGLMCPLVTCAPNAAHNLEFHDKEIKWNITNTGDLGLEISRIRISWPESNGDLIEVKRDGDAIHKGDFGPPSADIQSGWEGNANKRTIKPGKTDTLKFKFENDADTQDAYIIVVDFTYGCSVEL